jgi:pimeloyl-ACP methyl ester carboxylesterase
MNTLKTESRRSDRVKGPAGFLYVRDEGEGGIPVVFAHSFMGSTQHWTKQMEYLRNRRRVIAFDFRGHGKSDVPADGSYSAESLSDDMAAVIDSLGLERVVLVGHSMGGAAAIAYAGAHPELVAGLVLTGTPGKSAADQSKPIIAALESEAYPKVMDDYMKLLLGGARPEVETLINGERQKLSKDASLRVIKAMFAYDPLPALKRYKGPKLIIYTAREHQQPNALPHQVPDIDGEMVEGTSHWIHLDKPDVFNHLLEDFLKRVE